MGKLAPSAGGQAVYFSVQYKQLAWHTCAILAATCILPTSPSILIIWHPLNAFCGGSIAA